MRRMKLTPLAKGLIIVLVLCIAGFGVFKTGAIQRLLDKESKPQSSQGTPSKDKDNGESLNTSTGENVINISLDEWSGWKPILDANGGLTTKEGSIFDELGIKVNISVINDATQSSNALIKGELNGAGYTVNRYSFLYPKFKSAGVDVVMPYVNNSSSGGDGIIAKAGINSVEDLVGKKIGVPRFSEAQTLVEWLLNKSNLTDEQVQGIKDNMVFFETPDDCAKAFFSGKLDAAATWQPYLSQAQQSTDSTLLFSTSDATSIILDGIVFRQDFVDNNKELVEKFVEGSLTSARDLYETDFTSIKSFPLFATETEDNIKSLLPDAKMVNCLSNMEMLEENGTASALFSDMSDIWSSLGEESAKEFANEAFTDEIVKTLSGKFTDDKSQNVTFTEEQRNTAAQVENIKSLLSQNLTINFAPDSAVILEDSYSSLDEFVKTAKILDGTIIQIEGNVAAVGVIDPEVDKKLSEQRAKSVANYLSAQGVDPTRFIIVGNGSSKQIGDNNTEEGKEQNRRTDIYFKRIEG